MKDVRENERWEGGKIHIQLPPSEKVFSPLGYTVVTQMCYCTAEIKINSFVSCDLFISRSTGLWLSVILMEKTEVVLSGDKAVSGLFYFLISLVQGEVFQP